MQRTVLITGLSGSSHTLIVGIEATKGGNHAYDWLVSLAAQPLGYASAPALAAAWSPAVPLLIAAVLVAAACLGTAAVPGVRRLFTT